MMQRRIALILLALACMASAAGIDFYWESPESIATRDSRFPSSATNGTVSVVVWQDIVAKGKESGDIWLSARVYDGETWTERKNFAGPFEYAGDVPSIASVTIDAKGRILVPVGSGVTSIKVFISDDLGASFASTQIDGGGAGLLGPRAFVRSDGGYFLFATRGTEDNFILVFSQSDDGHTWPPMEQFGPAAGRKRAFLPAHFPDGQSDVVVFQAFHDGPGRSSYQLYSTVSTNKGRSWSTPILITGFAEPGSTAGFESYHNQRAKMLRINGKVSLVWERARTSNEKYAIYHSSINASGVLSGTIDRISSNDGYCYDPDLISFAGEPAVVWFDNRRGVNHVYLARKEGFLWTETELSKGAENTVFGRIVNTGENLEVYWQQSAGGNAYLVTRLAPDHSVRPPAVQPVNFASGDKGRGDLVRLSLRMGEDSSGIAGYSVAWMRGSKPEVPEYVQRLPEDNKISLSADEDGRWFVGVKVADYAGNWSDPVYVEYVRDTTPPASPHIAAAALDGGGFLPSNTFTMDWAPSEADDIAGYTWNLEYLASLDYLPVLKAAAEGKSAAGAMPGSRVMPSSFDLPSAAGELFSPKTLPPTVRSTGPSASFTNEDNGIFALSVAAIDSVGNVGKPAVRYVVLNKYVPHTYITYIDSKLDESGTVSLSIMGRGFADGGNVSSIFLDRDGREPWDISLSRSSGQFTVASDRILSVAGLSDLEEGSYRIGVVHPKRGIHISKSVLSVNETGTIKFGDFRHVFVPPWILAEPVKTRTLSPAKLMVYSIMFFALVILFASIHGISGIARDSIRIHQEVQALITGDVMPSEKKKRTVALRKRGLGLRFKLAFFTTTLVISVVLIVSIPIGFRFSANQEKTLARGLESRVHVLLESLASGARAYLPSQNILELGFLPSQMTALDEAKYATVTGNGSGNGATGIDIVWATNDPDINGKMDTERLFVGRSRLTSPESAAIDERVAVLDEEANRNVGELSRGIAELTQEGIKLALKTDAESVTRRDEIQVITRQLEEKLNAELSRLSASGIGSYPLYDPDELSRDTTRYVFFKPVLYRSGSDTRYVHGTVRVEISTESLLKSVIEDRKDLVTTTFYIALFAVLMGVLGALVLASIIISPIRKLADHVAMIRDTEDKEALDGKDIRLRSRDEIGLLGDTINEMTHGLVKAAAASKDLTVGKEVQKMFIPLETDESGRKLSCGSSGDDRAEFFGYYEGAKGVSGDYFDYIKLDDRHYAIIKCDVAGKGVPAALIMVEVATLFLDYFKDWKYAKNGYKLDTIVSKINDLIESRGFKGRFAAFTLCILDSVSGGVHFCNAGDNLVHIYSAAEKKMKLFTLPESSAAGVFPSFMIDMKGGFKVVSQTLAPGDVLFLYTDGIEEAKRLFRTPSLEVMTCAEPGLEAEAAHGNHSVGQDNEELGPDRVNAIIEAVFEKRRYVLRKWHNPEGEVEYEFDFTTCKGTLEEAIIALVSVEKVFRLYKDPKATEFNRVQVDRKVDGFLSQHFSQYSLYCGNRRDHPEYKEYLYYTNVREDDQYDDLTILAVRKK